MSQLIQFPWLLMAATACCNSAGSILLKQSRLAAVKKSSFLVPFLSPWFLTGLGIYSTGLILFAKALDRLPVSMAVPFSTDFGFFLTRILSDYLFGERLTVHQLVAVSLILVGVI